MLIGQVHILPALFEKVIMPFSVLAEWSEPNAPLAVANWVAHLPPWLELREPPPDLLHQIFLMTDLNLLGKGEREAIRLAMVLHAHLLLMG